MHAWTDSTTTLAWIQSSPHRRATFIVYRTSQIQSLTPPSLWRYVPTSENPVDCESRSWSKSQYMFLIFCYARHRPRSTTHSPWDNPDQHHFRSPIPSNFVIKKDHSHHCILL
ncbi:unnamed protein product [Macrosiphum euphorbiae]|nr:unnamed protein product [Macrosiphum euphorbiae]